MNAHAPRQHPLAAAARRERRPLASLRAAPVAALALAALAATQARAEQVLRREIRVNAAPVAVQAAANVQLKAQARGRKIFVPAPKGANDTLDDDAKRGKAGQGDVVTTVRGDKVTGKLLTIEPDGRLRLTSPQFEGEVVVLAAALERVELSPKEKTDGPDRIELSNGDRVVGDIVAITPQAIVIESRATGPLKISRKIATSIAFSQSSPLLLDSNFAGGKMKPWTARGGAWSVANGALQSMSHGRQTVFAKFEQTEAVTMEVQVQAMMHRYLNCELIVFADSSDNAYGRNSVIARFYSSNFYIMQARNGGTHTILNRSMGRVLKNATLRLAYDPATSKARVWIDNNDLGEFAIPQKLAKGQFVMFNSNYPCRVKRIRVMSGVVAPSGKTKQEDTASHVVRFANRDRVAASDLALADGSLSLKTEFGQIASPIQRVQSITFRSKGIEKPRRRKGDVRVETTDSQLTLRFQSLTQEHLVGKSYYLGEVKVRRACLRKIHFNLYK